MDFSLMWINVGLRNRILVIEKIKKNDLKQKFRDEKWIEENKLVVVESLVDMSMNFCITTTKEWVEENCPELLSKYKEFIRKVDEDDEPPYGRFGCPFLEYDEENIGYHYAEEVECNGYFQYIVDYEDEEIDEN